MTNEEHLLMVLVIARMYEAVEIVTQTLKSRGLWTDDDEKAFAHAVHDDDAKLTALVQRAKRDYLLLAKMAGVDPGS